MPGPFNFAPIAPLPAPAAPPSGFGQALSSAAANYPAQVQQAKQFDAEQQRRKIELETLKLDQTKTGYAVEEAKRARAKQNLSQYYSQVKTDKTGQKLLDPALIKAVEEAGKEAGVGGLIHTDPTTGQQAIDVHALSMATGQPLTQAQQSELLQTPPASRQTMYDTFAHPDVAPSDEFFQIPVYMTTAQQEAFKEKFSTKLQQLVLGNSTPETMLAQMKLFEPELAQSGLTEDDVKQMIVATGAELAPMAITKIAAMQELNLSREAQAAYIHEKTVEMPKALAQRIHFQNGKLTIDQENADTRRAGQQATAAYQQGRLSIAEQNAQTLAGRLKVEVDRVALYAKDIETKVMANNLKGVEYQAKSLQAQLKPLSDRQKQLASAVSQAISSGHAKAAGKPDDGKIGPDGQVMGDPNSLIGQLRYVTDQISKMTGIAQTAEYEAQHQKSAGFSAASGGSGRLTYPTPPGWDKMPQGTITLPDGTQVPGRVDPKTKRAYRSDTHEMVPVTVNP